MARRFRNTRRENRLEELGRVDAEKAYTSRGKRNLKEEKSRIRKELATGGRARPSPDQTRRAGPRRKFGPDPRKKQGPKVGRPKAAPKKPRDMVQDFKDQYKKHKRDKFIKDLKDHNRRRKPGDPPRIIDPKSPPKKDRIMTPLGVKVKYRKGGSAKGPNRPRPTGPHMWVRGDKRKKYSSGSAVSKGGGITHKSQSGIGPSKKSQKKYYDKQRDAVREMNMSGRGKQLRDRTFTDKKTGRLVPDTKRNRERYGKDRVYKSKASGGRIKYASGGIVMTGKKVGCQIK